MFACGDKDRTAEREATAKADAQKCADAVEDGWGLSTTIPAERVCANKMRTARNQKHVAGDDLYPCEHGGLPNACWVEKNELHKGGLYIWSSHVDWTFVRVADRPEVDPHITWYGRNAPDDNDAPSSSNRDVRTCREAAEAGWKSPNDQPARYTCWAMMHSARKATQIHGDNLRPCMQGKSSLVCWIDDDGALTIWSDPNVYLTVPLAERPAVEKILTWYGPDPHVDSR